MDNQIYIPPEGPPQESAPLLFAKIGLEKLYEMAWNQYQRFQDTPIAHLFPAEEAALKEASEKQAEFLCGVMGGPRLYHEKHGPPRMRARHLPFAIDLQARDIWLDCFKQAFAACEELGLDPEDQKAFLSWIEDFSRWMINKGP